MINLTLQRGYRRIDIVLREELSTIQSANVHSTSSGATLFRGSCGMLSKNRVSLPIPGLSAGAAT